MLAFVSRAQLGSDPQVKLYHTKEYVESLLPVHTQKNRLFQNKNRPQEQNALDGYVRLLQRLLQPPEKLGSCANGSRTLE